jgi:uncharacterized membrane protein YqjE
MATQPPDDIGDLSRAEDPRDQSLPELLKRLSAETTQLVHQELDLAKVELTQKGRQAGAGAGLFGSAAALALGALGALTACIILALDAALPAWLAALIVAAVYGVIAAVLAVQGRDRVKQVTPLAPEQTIETVKEDVEWAKTQTRSAKR